MFSRKKWIGGLALLVFVFPFSPASAEGGSADGDHKPVIDPELRSGKNAFDGHTLCKVIRIDAQGMALIDYGPLGDGQLKVIDASKLSPEVSELKGEGKYGRIKPGVFAISNWNHGVVYVHHLFKNGIALVNNEDDPRFNEPDNYGWHPAFASGLSQDVDKSIGTPFVPGRKVYPLCSHGSRPDQRFLSKVRHMFANGLVQTEYLNMKIKMTKISDQSELCRAHADDVAVVSQSVEAMEHVSKGLSPARDVDQDKRISDRLSSGNHVDSCSIVASVIDDVSAAVSSR